MTKVKGILKEMFGNAIYLKVSYLLLICFQMIIFFRPICDSLIKLVLVYGFLYLVYDLFAKRIFWKAPYVKFLLIFLALYAVSVVIHYQSYLWDNFIIFSYMAVSMLILFPLDPAEERGKMLKQLALFCRVLTIFLFVTTVISLLVYLLNINYVFYYFDKPFYIGTYQKRLWGIYPNPNTSSVLASIGLVLPFIEKMSLDNQTKKYCVFSWVNFSCQLLLIALSGSRGGELFLFALLGVILFFNRERIAPRLTKKALNSFAKYAISVLCLLVFVLGYYGLNSPIKKTLAWVPYGVATLVENVAGDGEEILLEPLEREKNAHMAAGTGRLRLWRIGLERFAERPLLGMTSKNLTDGVITDKRATEHVHNLYIQILGSSGIFGFLAFMMFKVCVLLRAMLYLFREKKQDKKYYLVVLLFAVAVATAVQQLVEVDELYRVESIPVITWTMLGYLVYFLPKRECEKEKADLVRS